MHLMNQGEVHAPLFEACPKSYMGEKNEKLVKIFQYFILIAIVEVVDVVFKGFDVPTADNPYQ